MRQPAKNIHFRSVVKTEELAGIYPSSNQEYQETPRFKEGAVIRSVEVVSLSN